MLSWLKVWRWPAKASAIAWNWWTNVSPENPATAQKTERFFLALFSFMFLVIVGIVVAGVFGLIDIFDPQFWREGGETREYEISPAPDKPEGTIESLTKTTRATAPTAEVIRNALLGLAGLVGGVFGIFQLYNAARRTRIMATDTQTKTEQERNERFVAAANLLKDDDASVRMAGVFALKRLAEEDLKKESFDRTDSYVTTVKDVLAGFIRDRTYRDEYPARPEQEYLPVLWPKGRARYAHAGRKGAARHWRLGRTDRAESRPPSQRLAISAKRYAATSQADETEEEEQLLPVDLRGAQLARLEARRVFTCAAGTLRAPIFRALASWDAQSSGRCASGDANLQDARLGRRQSSGRSPRATPIFRALASGAPIFRTLASWDANLQGTDLRGANLQGAHLRDAPIFRALTSGAPFFRALDLKYVNDLKSGHLENAVWPVGLPPNFA